jgi:hypothetical protein
MGALWRRRAVRHLVIGLAPLLVIGTALTVTLVIRFAQIDAPVREATGSAQATVVRGGLGPDGNDVELRWTDQQGREQLSRVTVPEADDVRAGQMVTIRYVPSDPSRVYVGGDATSLRLRDIAYGAFVIVAVIIAAVLITVVHIARRLAAERRPATTMPATYVQSKRGLVQRSWLILADAGREWWLPVHWDPVLTTMLSKAPCRVHGRPMVDRVIVVAVDGMPIWQSWRKRRDQPGGQLRSSTTVWSKSAQRRVAAETAPTHIGLARHLRGDGVIALVAPLLGLVWAFLDGTGVAGFLASTAVLAGLLFWLPALVGTDPT